MSVSAPTEPARRRHARSKPARPFWVELPFLLLIALTVAVSIKTFLVQPFYIPTESMLPTIEVNDRVMVSKLNYRFGEPQRGDIAVFISPLNGEDDAGIPERVVRHILEAVGIRTASADDLIKRVVAVGGDTVEIKGGVLLVNGEAVPEPYLLEPGGMPDFGPETVPADNVFVMGDNRRISYDSRRFGSIPYESLIGEAVVRIWPVSRFGGIDSVPGD
ncbi:MAG: signal peptidase I [Acidimicrobiia bacterium]|nr:signal peptidase I [Acidimicrobiia bacterium]